MKTARKLTPDLFHELFFTVDDMPRKDPEARKAYQKEYAQKNREKAYQRVKEWRKDNPEKLIEQHRRYAKKHPDVLAAKAKRCRDNNIEKVRARDRINAIAFRAANKSIIKERKAKYAKDNKHIVNAACSKRKAAKLQRTPAWIGDEELWLIQEVYELASIRTKMHGFSWHVDHIIPLQGELVSGLHTPENLQVIPAVENITKGNRYVVA